MPVPLTAKGAKEKYAMAIPRRSASQMSASNALLSSKDQPPSWKTATRRSGLPGICKRTTGEYTTEETEDQNGTGIWRQRAPHLYHDRMSDMTMEKPAERTWKPV